MLRFELASKTEPRAGVNLLEIQDFGTLQFSDWSQPTLRNLGAAFDTNTGIGWITVDVTESVADSIAKGVVAFQLRYGDESEDPQGKSRWYGITAAEEGASRAPQLVITFVP
jgi:hypothetical protein